MIKFLLLLLLLIIKCQAMEEHYPKQFAIAYIDDSANDVNNRIIKINYKNKIYYITRRFDAFFEIKDYHNKQFLTESLPIEFSENEKLMNCLINAFQVPEKENRHGQILKANCLEDSNIQVKGMVDINLRNEIISYYAWHEITK